MLLEKLYRIEYGTTVFGIITQRYNTRIISAAPICKWCMGKSIIEVLRYYKACGAVITLQYIRYIKE